VPFARAEGARARPRDSSLYERLLPLSNIAGWGFWLEFDALKKRERVPMKISEKYPIATT